MAASLGVLATALFVGMGRIDSLGSSLGARIDTLGSELRAEIRDLRDTVHALDVRLTRARG